MAQVRNNVEQTAAFARRVVCRALTVVGGVAAGTALAWWLSSASASAQAESPTDLTTAVQAIVVPVAEPALTTVDTVAEQLADPSRPAAGPLDDLGGQVTDLAGQLDGEVGLPESSLCATAECLNGKRHAYPADAFGRSDIPGVPALASAVTTDEPDIAVDTFTSRSAKHRVLAEDVDRRGSPAPARPMEPGLPDWPTPQPVAPAGVPTSSGHCSTGNAGDSHLFAVMPWQDRVADEIVAAGIATVTNTVTFGRVGAQPGVAPD